MTDLLCVYGKRKKHFTYKLWRRMNNLQLIEPLCLTTEFRPERFLEFDDLSLLSNS